MSKTLDEYQAEIGAWGDAIHPCPECQSETEWIPDCPGWVRDGKVNICAGSYVQEVQAGYSVIAQRCGNAALWVCTNPECDWMYREPDKRTAEDAKMTRPDWMYDPTDWKDDLNAIA